MNRPTFLRGIDRLLFAQARTMPRLRAVVCLLACIFIGYCASRGV